jgi:GR25 family glycosyltransferase involved in LPS biosynthesis
MNINNIPKFVINLKRREDRLAHIQKEMEYMGWDYELFEAIDEGCYVGCTLSHLNILNIAKERNYESVLIIEDDCTFMPYAKSFIKKIEEETENLEFAICNLAPTLNRPVNVSDKHNLFLDITNLPERSEHQRDVFATNMIIYHKSIYDDVFEITGTTYGPPNYYPIDEFNFRFIISQKQSYCPILPIAPQKADWSDVSNGNYSNFYTQTYNWNSYSPCKIPGEFTDYDRIQEIKKEKIHKDFYYVS